MFTANYLKNTTGWCMVYDINQFLLTDATQKVKYLAGENLQCF